MTTIQILAMLVLLILNGGSWLIAYKLGYLRAIKDIRLKTQEEEARARLEKERLAFWGGHNCRHTVDPSHPMQR